MNELNVLTNEAAMQMIERLSLMTLIPKKILYFGEDRATERALLAQRYPGVEWVLEKEWAVCNQTVDLIFANLILPWHRPIEKTLKEWQKILRPGGLFIFSMLGMDTLQELNLSNDNIVPFLIDMHDMGDLLIHSGFADPVLDVNHLLLTYREEEQLKKELCQMQMVEKCHLPQRVEKNADAVFAVTYEMIYGHCWQPEFPLEESLQEAGVVKIPLSKLQRHKR